MKFTNVEVYDMGNAIIASAFPMLSEPYDEDTFDKESTKVWANTVLMDSIPLSDEMKELVDDCKPLKRIKRLAKAPSGSGHDCALKGILVSFNVTAPRFWYNQFQRYHFADIVSSTSQVHSITKMDISKMPNIDPRIVEVAKEYIEKYKNKEIDLDTCISNMPQGIELTCRVTTNYLQLKSIYGQRKNHPSVCWQHFCHKFIKDLPLHELITQEED